MKVELQPAFQWDCPNCGVQNFARGLVPEMSEEESQELREDFGLEPWDQGTWMAMPTQVTCSTCGRPFDTLHYGDDEDY